MRKAELSAYIKKGYEIKKKLYSIISKSREKYGELLEEYQPRINELSGQADVLASQFKELFEQSHEAYHSEERELAKELSVAGKAIQAECEELNAQANDMRWELKGILDTIDECNLKIAKIDPQIRAAKRAIKKLRKTKVKGFSKSNILKSLQIEKILDVFPPVIFKEISSITYIDKLSGDAQGTCFGVTKNNLKTGKAEIQIFKHVFLDKPIREFMMLLIAKLLFLMARNITENILQWGGI